MHTHKISYFQTDEIFIFLMNRLRTPINEFIVFKYMYTIWHIDVHLLH